MPRQILAEVILRLQDQLSGKAKDAANALKQVEAAANGLGKGAGSGLTSASQQLKNIEKAALDAAKAGDGLKGWGAGFDKSLGRLKMSAGEIDALRQSWRRLNDEMAKSVLPVSSRSSAMQAWKNQALAHHAGVRQTLKTSDFSVAPVLSTSARFLGVGAGAYGMGAGVRNVAQAGAKNIREETRDYLAGVSGMDSARLSAAALSSTARYKSVDKSELHGVLRDTMMAFGGGEKGLSLALGMSETLAKAATVAQAIKGPEAGIQGLSSMIRAMDTLGRIDSPERMKKIIDGFTKALSVEGPEMNFRDLFTFAKHAKSAGATISDDFLISTLPGLMVDMDARRVGTAFGSTMAQVAAGRSTKQAKSAQRKYGLADENGFIDIKTAQTNPLEYVMKTLLPALRKKGINTDDNTEITKILGEVFSNQMVADLFTKLVTQAPQYQRNAENYANAKGLDGADAIEARDATLAWKGAVNSLTQAMAEAAMPIQKDMLPALSSMTTLLRDFASSYSAGQVSGKGGMRQVLDDAGTAIADDLRQKAKANEILNLEAQRDEMRKRIEAAKNDPQHQAEQAMRKKRMDDAEARWKFEEAYEPGSYSARVNKGLYEKAKGQYDSGSIEGMEAQVEAINARIGELGVSIQMHIVNSVNAAGPGAMAGFQNIMAQLKAAADAAAPITIKVAPAPIANPNWTRPMTPETGYTPEGRARGGAVNAGQLYQVGENGPELFAPGANGSIVPNHALEGVAGKSAGITIAGPLISGITINGGNVDDIMAQISDRIRDAANAAFNDHSLV